MWMSIPKDEITGKHFRKPKNNLLKAKTTLNIERYAKWGPGFYIQLAKGAGRITAPRQLRH